MTGERRRHKRYASTKAVRARAEGGKGEGSLKDISISGAAVATELTVDQRDAVELDIDDLDPLFGHVARTFDDGFAVEFELDGDDEQRLLSELSALHEDILNEEF